MRPDPAHRFADLNAALEALPPSPPRFFAKKVNKPPTPIRPEDLGSTAPALPHEKRRKIKKSTQAPVEAEVDTDIEDESEAQS